MSNLAVNDLIPLDICREILLRLPAGSLFRSRAVCKGWRTVIDDPSFARAHTNHDQLSHTTTLMIRNTSYKPSPLQTLDLDALNLSTYGDQAVASSASSSLDLTFDESSLSSLLQRFPVPACDGLVLVFQSGDLQSLEIWNPSTHERLQLPPVGFSYSGRVFIGFGYDQAAQDYKAVAMDGKQTRVYSLRSDTWRTIDDFICLAVIGDMFAPEGQGVFVCGALHWLFYNNKILALDLGTEKHRLIQLDASQNSAHVKNLDVLGGCLAMSGYSGDPQIYHVWVMKGYGSVDESWTKLCSFDRGSLDALRPVAYVKDKNQVFLQDCGPGFFLFDVEREQLKTVRIHGLAGNSSAQIIPQNIFRLRGLCGSSGRSRIKPLGPQKKAMKVAVTIKKLWRPVA